MAQNYSSGAMPPANIWDMLAQSGVGDEQQDPSMPMVNPEAAGPQDDINAQTSMANLMAQQPAAAPAPRQAPGPDFSSINALLSKFDATKMPGYQDQQDALSRLKKYRANMPQGSEGIDFSPIMALADAWGNTKSNLVGTYKKPATAEERADASAKVDEALSKMSGEISKEQMDALKERLVGEGYKLHYGAAKDDKAGKESDKFATHVIDKFNGDKAVQKTAQTEDAANNVLELLSSGNPIAYQSIPTYMARLSGEVGNLSEADKKPFGGSQALNDRFQQAFESAKDGKLTPENIKFVGDLVTKLKGKAVENRENTARRYSDQYGGSRAGVSPEGVFKYLAPGSDYKKPSGFKAGDVREKDGVKYQRDASGNWSPM